MGEQSTEDIWDVVYSSGRIFIGKIVHSNVARDSDYINRWPNEGVAVVLRPCFEITVNTTPIQLPNGNIGFAKNLSVDPVLLNYEEASVTLAVTAIIEGHQMKPGDQARYKTAVTSAIKNAQDLRAREIGIVSAERNIQDIAKGR